MYDRDVRGQWLLVSVTVILLGVAAGAVSLLLRTADDSTPPASRPAPEVSERPVAEEISLPGLVGAQNVVGVPAPIEGTLEDLMVGVGEEVFADQLLARINNTSIEADVVAAREELERAQDRVNSLESLFAAVRLEASRANADLSRVRSEFLSAERAALRQRMLYREGATPRLVYEEVQAAFEVKREEYETSSQVAENANERVSSVLKDLDLARRFLDEANEELDVVGLVLLAAEIVSPVNGVLTGIGADAGEEVHPETGDLFQIAVDLSRLEIAVEPEPPELARIHPGMPALVYLAEIPHEALPAAVKEVKDGRVVVEFISPTPAIMPGLSAQVTIKLP